MTLGQRIAQKRKELGLSQEGLGEQLGVSRQAIYKWESDASLPEIDKLITLSKIFSVSVGWLLGVEEEPASSEASPGELTEQQLAMVREIVDGYLAARPKPVSLKRQRLARLCGAAAVLALVVTLFNLFAKLDRLNQDFGYLHNSVSLVSSSVNGQISSITSRVEEILKSQNNLMAEWSAELASTDLRANTATFAVRAVPKTYVEGMTAVFTARSGEDTAELPVEAGADGSFTGRLTCPLTDQIDVSVVLITGDKRETQRLEDFYSLYTNSFPDLQLDSWLWGEEQDGILPSQLPAEKNMGRGARLIDISSNRVLDQIPDPPTSLRVGLFRDRKLLLWYEGSAETFTAVTGTRSEEHVEYIWRRPRDVTLEPGHEYCEAAVYTDEYGRQRVYSSEGISYNEQDEYWEPSTPYDDRLTDWEF